MASPVVLRIPRSDEKGSFVLVHASQTRSKALDLKLVGTDGLAPYLAFLRHSQAASHMVKNCPVSEDEWVEVLTSLLRQEPVEGMEAVATVDSESSVTITFRKQVRGITQRLGTLGLKYAPDEEIELFDWCGLASGAVVASKDTLVSVTAKANELEESVRQLRSQLDELIEAKKADEQELLEKFRDLLNEKKLKIREQQRVLAAASVDPGKLPEAEEEPHDDGKGHTAGQSRPSKRKAPAREKAADEDDESEGLEKMEVDSKAEEPAADASDEERQTTDDAGSETASEDEDDDEEPALPPTRTRGAAAAAAASTSRVKSEPSSSQPQDPKPAAKKNEPAPPKRDLPFMKKKGGKQNAPPPPAGSETDSDDEL